jgi:hypothetical protein
MYLRSEMIRNTIIQAIMDEKRLVLCGLYSKKAHHHYVDFEYIED